MKPCYRGNDDCPDDCCLGAGPLPTREQELRQIHGHPDPATDPVKLMRELASAVDRLREIAALAGTTKRKQAGCELAASWLCAHGFARSEGGYVPGVGFEDGAPALARRQAE